jgi:prevent-host-death family protein
MVPISQFSQGKATQVFARVKDNDPVVVLRNNQPIGVIVTVEDYRRMSEAEEEYYLLSLTKDRLEHMDDEEPIPESKLMEDLGITEEDIANAPDVELE